MHSCLKGADGVEVNTGKAGNNIFMEDAKVVGLFPAALQALGDLIQHVTISGKFAFQMYQGQGITNGVGLDRVGLTLQDIFQYFSASEQAVVTIEDILNAIRRDDKQAANQWFEWPFTDLPALGQTFYKASSLKNR